MPYVIDLSDKVAIVTGAAKGIGKAITQYLVIAGAQVVMDDLLSQDQVEPFLDEMEGVGLRPYYLCEDISREEGAQQLVHKTVSEFGKVDILVNNAGVVADWEKSWQVHVRGMFACSEAAKEDMKKRKEGRIINMLSTSVLTGGSGFPQYVSSKGGAMALTRYLARSYAPFGILVNGIMPAVIVSEMMMTRFTSPEEMIAHYTPLMPIGRVGYPEDIAKVVLFLCSDLSNYLLGEIIVADGGRMYVG
ncbi:MAG: 3-oxoacyl-ACP reductase [Anaerolineae bacterium]|jgi:NAD(P)-dependent dehydrogenase (short-subunit alcohol dehydrogenase family)|nr:MAG: 3-oxoacyl-ACP reductase [Anaerolineae bacterium]